VSLTFRGGVYKYKNSTKYYTCCQQIPLIGYNKNNCHINDNCFEENQHTDMHQDSREQVNKSKRFTNKAPGSKY